MMGIVVELDQVLVDGNVYVLVIVVLTRDFVEGVVTLLAIVEFVTEVVDDRSMNEVVEFVR